MIVNKIKTLDQAKTQLENLVLTLRHDGYSDDVDALSLVFDTLNAAADKDRQITALQTLLTATDALLDFLNKESVVPPAQIAWQIADARVTATNILAESQRIQEGE